MQGFDINRLLHEAHSRWLKPLEVYFILENHERYAIAPQTPTSPPSGSLFLFNRRVLRNFRRDGHVWRKKKNGRTVAEAHEKLKVGNVDALNCYYAHGEHNPYFQRRIYWMLDAAYEHIVLVHYREVSEGRYISGSISNLSAQSFSTFSQTTSISEPQLEGFTPGTSEFQEVYQNSDSLGSVEEISSWSDMEKFETYHSNTMDISGQPEVNQVFQKLAKQLSLGDEAEVHVDEKLPPYPSQYDNSQNLESSDYKGISSEKSHERLLHDSSLESLSDNNERQQVQSLGPGYTTESNQSPFWDSMLGLSPNSPGITTHESVSNLPAGDDLLESFSCRTITSETQFLSRNFLQNEHDLRSLSERVALSENSTWQQLDHGIIDPESCPNRNQFSETDLSIQLSATRILSGSDTPIEPPTLVSQFPEVERLHSQGTSTLVGTSSDITVRQESNIDWIGENDLSIENGIYTSDLLETWLDPRQVENSLGTNLSLTAAKNQWFSIREISPGWALSSDRAKEKMVTALLAAGSSAGAVTDPSPKDLIGKTPGDISAASGHKGLAGYLSEAALTSHLSSLTREESEISKRAAVVDAERAVESISQRSVQMHVGGGTEDELSLKDSLAAFRNAAQAAARIQAAFRVHSFRKRLQEADGNWDEYGLTAEDIYKLSAASKFPRAYSDKKFDKAALSIQKIYRSWKGRKDFLTLRKYVVKIQATVRGHQMRNKYRQFRWTVSLMEKVSPRWRREGVGLRGFQVDQGSTEESEDEDIVKVFRKEKVDAALGQAGSSVLSMVESTEARQQYGRMLEMYRQAKAKLTNADLKTQG